MPQETHSQFGVGLADFEDKGLAIRGGVLTHDRLFPAHPGLRKKIDSIARDDSFLIGSCSGFAV